MRTDDAVYFRYDNLDIDVVSTQEWRDWHAGEGRFPPSRGWQGPIPIIRLKSFPTTTANVAAIDLERALPIEMPTEKREPSQAVREQDIEVIEDEDHQTNRYFEASLDLAFDLTGANFCRTSEEELIMEGVLSPVKDPSEFNRSRSHIIGRRADEIYAVPDVQCSLGPEWYWGRIMAYTVQSPEYIARRADTHPYKSLRLVVLRLDRAVRDVLSPLSNVQHCAVWTSLEARRFLREYLREMFPDSDIHELLYILDYVEALIRTEVKSALRYKPSIDQNCDGHPPENPCIKYADNSGQRSITVGQRRSNADPIRLRLTREVISLANTNPRLTQLQICKALDSSKFPTPPNTKWSQAGGWARAFRNPKFRGSVAKWLSNVKKQRR